MSEASRRRAEVKWQSQKAVITELTTDLQVGGLAPRRVAEQIAKHLYGLGYRKAEAARIAVAATIGPRPVLKARASGEQPE